LEEFIKLASGKLGIDASTATSAVGSLLGTIKQQGDPAAVGQLFSKLPGASKLAASANDGSGGGSEGVLGKIGGMLGGVLGGKGEALGGLATSGLSPEKIPAFVSEFIDWIKQKVGPDVVNKVVSSIPALKSIVG